MVLNDRKTNCCKKKFFLFFFCWNILTTNTTSKRVIWKLIFFQFLSLKILISAILNENLRLLNKWMFFLDTLYWNKTFGHVWISSSCIFNLLLQCALIFRQSDKKVIQFTFRKKTSTPRNDRRIATGCSLNIVFFQRFWNLFRTLASLGFPSVSVSVHNGRSNTSAASELAEFRKITTC